MIQSYKDLEVWKKSVELTVVIYQITSKFPREELYGITFQIRKAAVAIPSNIAEGRSRSHTKEFIQFLKIAYSSGAELETQLIIANKIGFLSSTDYRILSDMITEIMKMINGLFQKLNPDP